MVRFNEFLHLLATSLRYEHKGLTNNYLCIWSFYNSNMILVFKHFFYKNYVGLSLWPFIILKHDGLKEDNVLINHERIHLKQQMELLIIPFYIIYVLEWLVRSLFCFSFYRGYQNISFEREAYANEHNLKYPIERRVFSFIKYLWH